MGTSLLSIPTNCHSKGVKSIHTCLQHHCQFNLFPGGGGGPAGSVAGRSGVKLQLLWLRVNRIIFSMFQSLHCLIFLFLLLLHHVLYTLMSHITNGISLLKFFVNTFWFLVLQKAGSPSRHALVGVIGDSITDQLGNETRCTCGVYLSDPWRSCTVSTKKKYPTELFFFIIPFSS